MSNIVQKWFEWFDISNSFFCSSWLHLRKKGVWPKSFLDRMSEDGIEMPDGWQILTASVMADKWCRHILGINQKSHVYQGYRDKDGKANVKIDGEFLSLQESLNLRNHSSTGFEWGYQGSGPAQLALAILLKECDVNFASDNYQIYKRDVIAKLPRDYWVIRSEQVSNWCFNLLDSSTDLC